jgi:hypothetical protein
MECLKKHDDELSANCKKAVGDAQANSQKAKTK